MGLLNTRVGRLFIGVIVLVLFLAVFLERSQPELEALTLETADEELFREEAAPRDRRQARARDEFHVDTRAELRELRRAQEESALLPSSGRATPESSEPTQTPGSWRSDGDETSVDETYSDSEQNGVSSVSEGDDDDTTFGTFPTPDTIISDDEIVRDVEELRAVKKRKWDIVPPTPYHANNLRPVPADLHVSINHLTVVDSDEEEDDTDPPASIFETQPTPISFTPDLGSGDSPDVPRERSSNRREQVTQSSTETPETHSSVDNLVDGSAVELSSETPATTPESTRATTPVSPSPPPSPQSVTPRLGETPSDETKRRLDLVGLGTREEAEREERGEGEGEGEGVAGGEGEDDMEELGEEVEKTGAGGGDVISSIELPESMQGLPTRLEDVQLPPGHAKRGDVSALLAMIGKHPTPPPLPYPLNFQREEAQESDLLWFLHMPKAAGMTMTRMIKLISWNIEGRETFHARDAIVADRFDPNFAATTKCRRLLSSPQHFREEYRTKLVGIGHTDINVEAALEPRPVVWMTMLRHPLKRVESWYNFNLPPPDVRIDAHHRKMAWESLEHLKEKMDILMPGGIPDDMTLEQFSNLLVELQLDNYQTRSLSGGTPHTFSGRQLSDEDMLYIAKRQLDATAYIGIAERFDDSMRLLAYTFGVSLPTLDRRNISLRHERASLNDSRVIRGNEWMDRLVYDYAVKLFDERYERMREDLGDDNLPPLTHSPDDLETSVEKARNEAADARALRALKKHRKRQIRAQG